MKFKELDIKKFSPCEWAKIFAEAAHVICFNEVRDPGLDRIDFALVTFDDNTPSTFCTCREFDSETVYWQYGGAFPNIEKSPSVWKNYCGLRDYCLDKYKRITTYIQNTNAPMLKMAMKAGFLVIGTRTFKGEIFLELINEGV